MIMNEKEVLIRIVDIKGNHMIRAEYTSIPSEMLKMYHYMKNKDGLYLRLECSEDKYYDARYDDVNASVEDIEIVPGGDTWMNCIDVYVIIKGEQYD